VAENYDMEIEGSQEFQVKKMGKRLVGFTIIVMEPPFTTILESKVFVHTIITINNFAIA